MTFNEHPLVRRWAGLLAAVLLLAVCLLVLGRQTAASGIAEPVADAQIVLERNEGYYDAGSVAISQATSLFLSQEAAWSRYQAGDLDTITPPDSALASIEASPIYGPQLHTFPGPYTYFYGFSHDVPPLDDPQVRAALASAIDRGQLIDDVLEGDEWPAVTLTPPRHVGYVDGYALGIGRPYSPTLAASLLAASGYTGDPPITLMVNDSSYHEPIAAAVRDQWYATLGVSVTLDHLPWPEYLDLLQNGSAAERPGVWRMGWGSDYPDAHNWHHDAMNFVGTVARYDKAAYGALVEAAAGEMEPAVRLDLYEQVETTLVASDTALVPLFTMMSRRLARPDLVRSYRSAGGQRLDDWSFSGDPRPVALAWGRPSSLDPALSFDFDYLNQLFLGLTGYDAESGAVVPELAVAWQASADGSVYTFTLRSDATWTDGQPVTAHDVEYGVLRSLDPATGAGYASVLYDIEQAQAYHQGQIADPALVGVEALDNTHVRFTLEGPAAYFPAIVAMPVARPQPHWAIEAHGADWTQPAHIVTNGPFKLTRWDPVPHLVVEKWADGDPISGNHLVFHIRYRNVGDGAAVGTVLTDTMEGGLSYVSDTSGLPHTGSGSDPIVWDLGTVPADSSVAFEVTVEVTAAPSQTVTNRVQIATEDPNDQGDPSQKESAWSGHVGGPQMLVDYGEDALAGLYAVGHTFWVTVTDRTGTVVKATATAVTEPGGTAQQWGWADGFLVEGSDWPDPAPDIVPGDVAHFRSDDGYAHTVQVGTLTGKLNSAEDTVAGTISAPWLANQHLTGEVGAWGFTWKGFAVDLDGAGAGAYAVDFSPADLEPGFGVNVRYMEPDGDVVATVIPALELQLRVYYDDDKVDGNYEPGHTGWITVTQSGTEIAYTIEITTAAWPWWGGNSGFSTCHHPWDPERPDLAPGDWIEARMDTGYTSTVQVGTLTGRLDAAQDEVRGTVDAPWLGQPVTVLCSPRDVPGGAPGKNDLVSPNGSDPYVCSWDPDGEWDVQPGDAVIVGYRAPDGDSVHRSFVAAEGGVYLPLVVRNSGP